MITKKNISTSSIVKVNGVAQVWDFKRLKDFFEKFNEVGTALSYITNLNPAQKGVLEALKTQIETSIKALRNSNRRAELAEQQNRLAEVNKLLDPIEVAKTKNMYVDPDYLRRIGFLTDMFYSDNIEVVIIPHNGNEKLIFRCIADRQWFRVTPEMLRALYAGHNALNWTMVGQVTHMPVLNVPSQDNATTIVPENNSTPNAMRDAYRNLVKGYYAMESTFSDNESIVEIVIHPLAIYRESTITL
jgi:hypothetical protein